MKWLCTFKHGSHELGSLFQGAHHCRRTPLIAETICDFTTASLCLRVQSSVSLEVPATPGARFAKAVKGLLPAWAE